MPTPERIQRLKKIAAQRQSGLTVVLENIHDPHNALAAFRCCDAFGVQNVHLIFTTETPFNPHNTGKGIASSANKWLTFRKHRSTECCLNALKEEGYLLAATVVHESSTSLFKANLLAPKLAILIGNEHRGLSKAAITMADIHLQIPMAGMVDSLNLSVALGILLFEAARQRALDSFRLDQDEQTRLLHDFLSR